MEVDGGNFRSKISRIQMFQLKNPFPADDRTVSVRRKRVTLEDKDEISSMIAEYVRTLTDTIFGSNEISMAEIGIGIGDKTTKALERVRRTAFYRWRIGN